MVERTRRLKCFLTTINEDPAAIFVEDDEGLDPGGMVTKRGASQIDVKPAVATA